jgi:SAM-dependent methyltransferase
MRAFIRALIVLHRAFRRRDLRTRVHALLRFLTCPFLRVVKLVPPGARLLEIGAGHGVFSALAADRGAHVVAVEPDLRKAPYGGLRGSEVPRSRGDVAAEPRNAATTQRVSYVAGFDTCVTGMFDAIAIIDVLYKIPLSEWDPLLARARERLRGGGTLIIKEHDPTARLKNSWNAAQEWLVSRVRLTLGESFSYESPAAFATRLERAGFRDVTVKRVDRGYPHPHVVYVGRV